MLRLLAALLVLLSGCTKNVPLAPPEFHDPGRAPTGDAVLEQRIADGLRIQALGPQEVQILRERVSSGIAEEADLSVLLAYLTGQGRAGEAVNLLHRRALNSPQDEGKTGDALGFAMGHYQWQTCADMARQYLERSLSAGHFMIRALCLERAGNLPASKENFAAAEDVRPMERATLRRIIQVAVERGSSGPMEPADDATFFEFLPYGKRLGPADRVFLAHLLGRFDQELSFGTLDIGGAREDEVQSVVDSRARSYRYCYYLADGVAKRRGKLIGSAQVEWKIGPLGEVLDVKVVQSDWARHPGSDAMDKCLVEQVQRLRFPRTRYGFPVPMRHRFVYQPVR
jgi:hypothetical protein